jgi:predicted PurR-regulated permease PerM
MPFKFRVAMVLATLVLSVAAVGYLFVDAASEQVVRLSDRVDASVEKVIEAAEGQPLFKKLSGESSSVASMFAPSMESFGFAQNLFATAFGGATDCLILLVLSIYFCISPKKYRSGATAMLPPAWRPPFDDLLDASSETLWRWMLGRLLAMVMVGVLFGIGLSVIGIPMAMELAIFAGLVTFIPNLGGIVAVIPSLLVASQEGSSELPAVMGLYIAIQFAESYLITPLVQEHQVSLPPAMVILAQIVAGLLFGFWGLVFATPIFAVSLLWIKRLYIEQWIETP